MRWVGARAAAAWARAAAGAAGARRPPAAPTPAGCAPARSRATCSGGTAARPRLQRPVGPLLYCLFRTDLLRFGHRTQLVL